MASGPRDWFAAIQLRVATGVTSVYNVMEMLSTRFEPQTLDSTHVTITFLFIRILTNTVNFLEVFFDHSSFIYEVVFIFLP